MTPAIKTMVSPVTPKIDTACSHAHASKVHTWSSLSYCWPHSPPSLTSVTTTAHTHNNDDKWWVPLSFLYTNLTPPTTLSHVSCTHTHSNIDNGTKTTQQWGWDDRRMGQGWQQGKDDNGMSSTTHASTHSIQHPCLAPLTHIQPPCTSSPHAHPTSNTSTTSNINDNNDMMPMASATAKTCDDNDNDAMPMANARVKTTMTTTTHHHCDPTTIAILPQHQQRWQWQGHTIAMTMMTTATWPYHSNNANKVMPVATAMAPWQQQW